MKPKTTLKANIVSSAIVRCGADGLFRIRLTRTNIPYGITATNPARYTILSNVGAVRSETGSFRANDASADAAPENQVELIY